jgi:3-oxoacyl-[acyl-carrier protein] reductase
MTLTGGSALISGASRGIGRAIALALAREGVQLTLLARTPDALEQVVEEVSDAGGKAFSFPGDLRQESYCEAAVEAALHAYGKITILVNNAGVGLRAPLSETSDDDWARVIETNLAAPFRLTRAALPHLLKTGGHVFMISSLAGSNPIAGMSAYCASKAALDQLSACLMLETRHAGVKVTTIAPGSVDTSFGGETTRDGSWKLQPEDVAQTVIVLLKTRSDAHLSRVEMRPLRPRRG